MQNSSMQYDVESLRFALWLCANEAISPPDAFAALQACASRKPKIGKLALTRRLLTVAQGMEVLKQQTVIGMPYGETAIQLGFITREQLDRLLRAQCDATPSLIDVLVNELGHQRKVLMHLYHQFANGAANAFSKQSALVPDLPGKALDFTNAI